METRNACTVLSLVLCLLLFQSAPPMLEPTLTQIRMESVSSIDAEADDLLTQADHDSMDEAMGVDYQDQYGAAGSFFMPVFFQWGEATSLRYIHSNIKVSIDADERPDDVFVRLDTNDVAATLRGTETWEWLTSDPALSYTGMEGGEYTFEGDVIVDLLFPTLYESLMEEFYNLNFLWDVGTCLVSIPAAGGAGCAGFLKSMFDGMIHILMEMLSNCIFPDVWIDEVWVDNQWRDVDRVSLASTEPAGVCAGIGDAIEDMTEALESLHIVEYFLYTDVPTETGGRQSTGPVELQVYKDGVQVLPYTNPFVSFIDYGGGTQYVQIYNPNGHYEVRVVGNEDGHYTFGAIETKDGDSTVLDVAVDEAIGAGESQVASSQEIDPSGSGEETSFTWILIALAVTMLLASIGGMVFWNRRQKRAHPQMVQQSFGVGQQMIQQPMAQQAAVPQQAVRNCQFCGRQNHPHASACIYCMMKMD